MANLSTNRQNEIAVESLHQIIEAKDLEIATLQAEIIDLKNQLKEQATNTKWIREELLALLEEIDTNRIVHVPSLVDTLDEIVQLIQK